MTTNEKPTLSEFLNDWTADENRTRESFLAIKEHLDALPVGTLEFVPRPGITYSLRAVHPQQARPLFAMVDVIDDDPEDRWLSVVFYKDMVTDPDEAADEVPEGLFGEDARCFDLYEHDEDMVRYILARVSEAAEAAARA